MLSTQTVPASLQPTLEKLPGAARVDGKVSAIGVYVLSTDGKVVGGSGPPAFGGNWTDAPAGHGLEGLVIVEGHEPHGADEVVLDESTADRAGYELGDQVPIVTATETARRRTRRWSASPASATAARSTARRTPPSTPRPPSSSSSTARTPSTTSGSPPRTASRRRS